MAPVVAGSTPVAHPSISVGPTVLKPTPSSECSIFSGKLSGRELERDGPLTPPTLTASGDRKRNRDRHLCPYLSSGGRFAELDLLKERAGYFEFNTRPGEGDFSVGNSLLRLVPLLLAGDRGLDLGPKAVDVQLLAYLSVFQLLNQILLGPQFGQLGEPGLFAFRIR